MTPPSIPVKLNWTTNYTGTTLPVKLDDLDFSKITADGVYVIYQHATGNIPARAIRVGQGIVKDRLCTHKDDPTIGAYRIFGPLYVMWAATPAHVKNGAERYLADLYQPLVGDAFPNVVPITVSLPWVA